MKFFDRFRKKKEGEQPDVSQELGVPPAAEHPAVEPPGAPLAGPAADEAATAVPRPATDLGTLGGGPAVDRPAPVINPPVITPTAVETPPAALDVQPAEFEKSASAADAAQPPVTSPANPIQPAPPVPPATPVPTAKPEPTKSGWFGRLKEGLKRTSTTFSEGMGNLFLGRKEIDDELLEELETQLLTADLGIDATLHVTGNLSRRVSRKELADAQALYRALQEELATLLEPATQPLVIDCSHKPFVILMVGVNGVGKTTTIGKLARRYIGEGKSVMLAAGDTFRAAAVEQLQVWGDRNNVPVIAQHTGADSASVLFDALQAAKARNVDVLIADTAGRLHNKEHLMEELKKVLRVMKKIDPTAPHEVMLVLDAGTGQNALTQARHFQEAVGVTGITLTKLDGTAKGGIIFAISRQCKLPIRFIGVGEKVEDLRPFEADDFVRALFDRNVA